MTEDKKTTFNGEGVGVLVTEQIQNYANQKGMFESLLAIQRGLKTITKNKKAYTGSYADMENIWESIRHLINDNEFVIDNCSDEHKGKFGVWTVATHVPSGYFKRSFIPYDEWESRLDKSGKTEYRDAQDKGGEMTYYVRYNLKLIFNIVIADEDKDMNRKIGNYNKTNTNGELSSKKLLAAKDADEARKIYNSLSKEERNTAEVVNAVAFIKKNLV